MFGTDVDETAPAEAKGDVRARPGWRPPAAPGTGGPIEELAQLTELWKDGALTDAEFAGAKARLLARIGR